jgi:hypothetical protein
VTGLREAVLYPFSSLSHSTLRNSHYSLRAHCIGGDSFSHLSSLGELDYSFFDPNVVINKQRSYHIIKYAGDESMEEQVDGFFIAYSVTCKPY